LLAFGYGLLALLAWRMLSKDLRWRVVGPALLMALGLVVYNITPWITEPLAAWGRSLDNQTWSRVVVKVSNMITVFTQPTMTILGFTYLLLSIFMVTQVPKRWRLPLAAWLLVLSASLSLYGKPLALVGTPYIVIAAYAVRSLPASVRAGVAALQQIDPAIEEASTSLGADAQYTFRHITLPLIAPAFIAGLIFAFARHMTSLSAIIFLTTAEWPILTVWILSEVEQGGMSTAAAYSMILIFIVLAAIGLTYLFVGRVFATDEGIDLTIGGG